MKAVQVICDLPYQDFDQNHGYHIILEDEGTGARFDIAPKEKDQKTIIFGKRMFDIYGREVNIDPAIEGIIKKVGCWNGAVSDMESYLVVTTDKRTYLAYINYYQENGEKERKNHTGFVKDLNPLFGDNYQLEVELVCSDFEVVETEFFPKDSAILRIFGDSDQRIWLVKDQQGYFLIRPELTTELGCAVFEKKADSSPSNFKVSCFDSVGFDKDGCLFLTTEIMGKSCNIATDDRFVEKMCEKSSFDYYIPFYLL